MQDIITAIEVRIDTYKRLIERTRKQAYIDSEYGYEGSSQFNKGQQFAYEIIVSDLEELLARFKKEEGQE